MVAASQLCFAPSRPSHHHSSWSNSRTLAHLSVDRDPSRHLSPSEPRPSSLWQSRSRLTKSTTSLHTRYLCSHPILFLSSSRPLVLSSSHPLDILSSSQPPLVLYSCSKAQPLLSRWHTPTLGINLIMQWLLLQGTLINAIERLQDKNIH
jgi:hypothetical protein